MKPAKEISKEPKLKKKNQQSEAHLPYKQFLQQNKDKKVIGLLLKGGKKPVIDFE